ncbi:MAG: flagellar hook-associated protein FlgL [Firmicutes bacterium]|nr:flagellar hook-associated protein FlgL [Bacillota bacterium]
MRITNRMMNEQVLQNLHAGMKRLADYNQQLSTGKKVSRPHEDPVIIRKSMGLNSNLAEIQQYTRNLDQGLSWLETTDSAINQVINSLHRAKELAVQGANGTWGQDDMERIAEEVDQIYQHVYTLSKTQYDGKYIFSGTKTLTAPYDLGSDGNVTAYQGDTNSVQYEIGHNVYVAVNVVGEDLFADIFAALEGLRSSLQSGDQSGVDSAIGSLDSALGNALTIQSKVGAAANRFELTKIRLAGQNVNITELLSENEDVDIAEVIMELNMQENVYKAALGSAARIIQPSLIDFLR